MNKKILATIVALAMVSMTFAMLVPAVSAADDQAEPSAFPTSMLDPFMSDVSTVGFFVAGVIDIAGANVIVDVDSTTDAFADGAGNFGSFSATSNAAGAYRVSVTGLNEALTYYYRVRFVDGGDTTYFPAAGTAVGPTRIGATSAPVTNTAVSEIIRETVTATGQPLMLATMSVDNTWPLSFFTVPAPAGMAAFANNNLRDMTTGFYYTQNDVTSTFYLAGYGMWDGGSGLEYWSSVPLDDTYTGIPAPLSGVDTYPPASASTADATGPTGTSTDNTPDVTFTTTGSPATVDIWSWDGASWTNQGTDADGVGPFTCPALADGTYSWYAQSPDEAAPTVVGDAEAGPYTVDATAPTFTFVPLDTATSIAVTADVVVTFDEPMNTGTVTYTSVPNPVGGYTVVWTVGNTVATYSHATDFAPSTLHTFTVTAGADVAGNPLVSDATAFTTGDPLPPQTTIDSIAPAYVGQLPDDVVLTVTGDDTGLGDSNVVAAEYRIDGGAWIAMTPGAIGVSTQFTATIDLHGVAIGNILVEARASDGGWDATPAGLVFGIADTTAPEHGYDAASPVDGATRDTGSTVDILVDYHDFTDYTVAEYQINENLAGYGAWTPMTVDGTWTGSFGADFSFQVTLAADGFVDYQYRLTDGGGNAVVGAEQTLNFQTAAAVADPYPVFGYTTYYNGAAGVMEYNVAEDAYGRLDPASSVDVTWWNTDTLAFETITTASNAASQYSVDIYNYTDGATIWINVTSGTYGNIGYNTSVINVANGQSEQDAMSGVPYEVLYNLPPAGVTAGAAFPLTYDILDINGAIAQGYFTYAADGPFDFYSGDLLFVNDVAHPLTFDGLGGAVTDGTYTATVTLVTGGLQWINISEGGSVAADGPEFLTPWGAWTYLDGSAGYLNDWDNVTILVASDFFQWNIVAGWNLISVPMNPDDDGLDLTFGAFDIAREIEADIPGATAQIADRTGGNPSAYTTFDYGTAEGAANDFATDYTSGYWVNSLVAGIVIVQAQNCTGVGDNIGAIAVGEWNLIGFTHNYTVAGVYNAALTADSFATGVVDTGAAPWSATGGATNFVATWFDQGTQRYDSYVVTSTFPGMIAHDWVVNTAFAWGYWVWSDTGGAITFDVDY